METFTLFWGQESPFSQHYMATFVIENIMFNCEEQYMMYRKALYFEDWSTADKIMQSSNPKHQKALGQQVGGFSQDV